MSDQFLQHLEDEALYGLEHSRGHSATCNSMRALRLIIAALRQHRGIEDGHPLGWAKPEVEPKCSPTP